MHAYTPADTRFSGIEYSPNPIVVAVPPGRTTTCTSGGTFDLYAGGGQKLQPGASYPDAQGNADGPGPGVRVSGGPAWCNQTASAFTVHSISTCRTAGCARSTRASSAAATTTSGPRRAGPGASAPATTSRSRAWMVPGTRPRIEVPRGAGTCPAPIAPRQRSPGRRSPAPGRPRIARRRAEGLPRARGGSVRLGTKRADRLLGTKLAPR